MNKVKKFATFVELKSDKNITIKNESILKKHETFEKVIKDIRTTVINKIKPKQ